VLFITSNPAAMRSSSFTSENSNGRLDKTFWGVPTEPYGFSNGARGVLGSPKFDDATITLDAATRPSSSR